MIDIKIVNGCFPNFDKNEFIEKDISIKDGKIIKIGRDERPAKKTIDASNKIVSPGFIDIHAHEEELSDNGYFYTANFALNMGVTTKIAGNCGINFVEIPVFKSYLEKYGAPTNYKMLLGNNYLRTKIGFEEKDRYRSATKSEIEKMKSLVREYLSYGILGISYGIEYSPGMQLEEILEIAKSLDDKNYLLSAHYRYDGKRSVEAVKEMIEIGKLANIPMQISHLGSCSAMGYMQETLDLIDKAVNRGIDVLADCYPYDAFCTQIGSAVFDEGCFEEWGKTYSDILIVNHPYFGQRCYEDFFHKVRKEHPNMLVVAFVMNEEEVELAYKSPYVMVSSDTLFIKDTGHPRGAGSFPRVLSKYVREKKSITLIDALKKMTLMPAQRTYLHDKGVIAEGKDADIVIFDKDTIKDNATFEKPTEKPTGIEYVIINGQIAIEKNKKINDNLGTYICN